MKEQIITNEKQLNDYIDFLRVKLEKDKVIKVSCKNGKQRTLTQNKSLHLYCKHLAEALNDAGFDCMNFFNQGFSMPWNEKLVKEMIWKPVQVAMIDKGSTTEANTVEYTKVYDVINQHLINNRGVFVSWPSQESLMYG